MIIAYFIVGLVVGIFACATLAGLADDYGRDKGLTKKNKGH